MQVLIAAAGRRDLRGEEKILRHAGAHEKAGQWTDKTAQLQEGLDG